LPRHDGKFVKELSEIVQYLRESNISGGSPPPLGLIPVVEKIAIRK
jgi:hypothetical protein